MIQNVNFSFKGVRPEYKKADGTKVYPIAKDPCDREIKEAMAAAKGNNSQSGLNGFVYPLGEDLVVKRYMGKGISHNYMPEGERANLDRFFESGLNDPQIQKGMYGFETPDGVNYLVTTRINGANPRPDGKNLNRENLTAITSFLAKFDKGQIDPKGSYVRFMHYDLGPGNLNVSKRGAGVFDFEHSNFEKLDKHIEEYKKGRNNGADCNRGDVAPFPTNLRGFEYRTLEEILRKNENPQELFLDYLSAKSSYHFEMAENYEQIAHKITDKEKAQFFRLQGEKERNHGFVLKETFKHPKLNEDVIKAEAMKIQLARYIYTQSPFSNFEKDKFNPEQLREYFGEAKEYFDKKAHQTRNNPIKHFYFEDCKNVMKGWDETARWMDFQLQEPDERYKETSPEFYKTCAENHKLILGKITNERAETLDSIVM